MGGSGGSSYPPSRDIPSLQERARAETQQQALVAEVNALLAEKLATINSRDVNKIGQYLDGITEALAESVEDVTQLLFGGSVAKHTYVDGLSDVDALVLLSEGQDRPPSDVRDEFAQTLRERLPTADVKSVEVGDMAVTVEYRDGTTVQLIAAVRQDDRHVAVPSADGSEWRAIMPRRFARALTRVNQSNGQLVVPTIKIAKSILAVESSGAPLSGYHVEALAVAAFREYEGPRNLKSTAEHFFNSASENVLRPIADTTGQSRHLDEYLGPSGSPERQKVAAQLRRIAARMRSASSVGDWEAIVDGE